MPWHRPSRALQTGEVLIRSRGGGGGRGGEGGDGEALLLNICSVRSWSV